MRRAIRVLAWLAACGAIAEIGCASNTVDVADGSEGGDASTTTGPSVSVTSNPTAASTSMPVPTTGQGTDASAGTTTQAGTCSVDADCDDPAAPLCLGGDCSPCDAATNPDDACAARDASTPICDRGACVGCPDDTVCPSPYPTCGCRSCTAHAQCPDGAACDLEGGTCLVDDVLYADHDAPCPGEGTDADPFCGVQLAIDAIGEGGAGTVRVRRGLGAVGYVEDLAALAGQTIGLLGDSDQAPIVTAAAGGSPSILVVTDAATTVYLDRLRLRSSGDGPAVHVSAGTLYANGLEVSESPGGGLLASDGASVHLDNGMLGYFQQSGPGIEVASASLQMRYTSIAYLGANPAILCTRPVGVTMENSIVAYFTGGTDIDCPDATVSNLVTRDEVGPMPGDFVWFENHLSGDLHLRPEGAAVFADYAQWNTGDPATDIDGDPRPRVDGTPDFPGADVPAGM